MLNTGSLDESTVKIWNLIGHQEEAISAPIGFQALVFTLTVPIQELTLAQMSFIYHYTTFCSGLNFKVLLDLLGSVAQTCAS